MESLSIVTGIFKGCLISMLFFGGCVGSCVTYKVQNEYHAWSSTRPNAPQIHEEGWGLGYDKKEE